MQEKTQFSRIDAAGGLVAVGCLMFGIGAGLYYGGIAVPAGTLTGLGIGAILFGIIKAFVKE